MRSQTHDGAAHLVRWAAPSCVVLFSQPLYGVAEMISTGISLPLGAV